MQAEVLASGPVRPPGSLGGRETKSCRRGGVERVSLVGKAVGGTVTLNNVANQPEIGLPGREEREAGGWRGRTAPHPTGARECLASTPGGPRERPRASASHLASGAGQACSQLTFPGVWGFLAEANGHRIFYRNLLPLKFKFHYASLTSANKPTSNESLVSFL